MTMTMLCRTTLYSRSVLHQYIHGNRISRLTMFHKIPFQRPRSELSRIDRSLPRVSFQDSTQSAKTAKMTNPSNWDYTNMTLETALASILTMALIPRTTLQLRPSSWLRFWPWPQFQAPPYIGPSQVRLLPLPLVETHIASRNPFPLSANNDLEYRWIASMNALPGFQAINCGNKKDSK